MSSQMVPNRVMAVYTNSFPCAESVIPNIFYPKCILVFFTCNVINLMVSCSLLVLMQKIIFTVEKSTKIVASRAALFGSDINQIIRKLGLCPLHHWGSLQRSLRLPSCI